MPVRPAASNPVVLPPAPQKLQGQTKKALDHHASEEFSSALGLHQHRTLMSSLVPAAEVPGSVGEPASAAALEFVSRRHSDTENLGIEFAEPAALFDKSSRKLVGYYIFYALGDQLDLGGQDKDRTSYYAGVLMKPNGDVAQIYSGDRHELELGAA